MESQLFIRAATASFAGHMVLVAGLFVAEVHPFEYAPPQSIAVDIVSPKEIPAPVKKAEPDPKPPDNAFDVPDIKQAADQTAAAAPKSAPAKPSPAAPSSATAPKSSDSRQAALETPAAAQTPPPAPAYKPPEPDITVKYGVLLGLPAAEVFDAGGAGQTTKADLSSMDTAAFRRHLKTCSKMPGSVSPTDNIRIVLRVPFTADGKIAAPPALIEASASPKGPELMKGAVAALIACQPYAMLPPERYDEWKVLDLSFTPHDFAGG